MNKEEIMKKYILIGLGIAVLMVMFIVPAFSQAQEEPQAQPAPDTSVAAPAPEASELSIYGEVQAVDATVNSLKAQYYDYDSDEEKTVELLLDKDTKIENAANISEIKKGDWVDVTYTVKDGKNMAKSVMVEKEEAMSPEDVQAPPVAGETEEE